VVPILTSIILVLIAVLASISASVIVGEMFKQLPPRKVSEFIEVTGMVSNVTICAYDMNVGLRILSSNSSQLKVDDQLSVRMKGIGPVDKWRCYSLKMHDVIRVRVRFVEDAFWEAFDTDWSFFIE